MSDFRLLSILSQKYIYILKDFFFEALYLSAREEGRFFLQKDFPPPVRRQLQNVEYPCCI